MFARHLISHTHIPGAGPIQSGQQYTVLVTFTNISSQRGGGTTGDLGMDGNLTMPSSIHRFSMLLRFKCALFSRSDSRPFITNNQWINGKNNKNAKTLNSHFVLLINHLELFHPPSLTFDITMSSITTDTAKPKTTTAT